MNIDLIEAMKTVINYYETAMKGSNCNVNYYFEPHRIAEDKLIKGGMLRKRYLGSIFMGMEYKGHLFEIYGGSGDCEELLRCKGKILSKTMG